MRYKLIAAGAAIALAATVGSASAAERFTTMEGIAAQALTPQEMGVVIGAANATLSVAPTGGTGSGSPARPPIASVLTFNADATTGLEIQLPSGKTLRGVGTFDVD